MKSARTLLAWIDTNLLFLLSAFLLAFIPLFPKIPLFDVLPGYIVRVRIEDFLIIFAGLVWLRDVYRKRITWNTNYFWFVCLYAVGGALSILMGVILLQTIPLEVLHIGKSGLHYFRYLEYFSLFFFLFSSIKTKKQILTLIVIMVITLLGIVGYGIGQKYARFPVYSTMNREYSKGERLYLQAGARPQSTFAGHYDLAAYLVIVLPILYSLALGGIKTKSLTSRMSISGALFLTHAAGLVMLILSGSKMSLIGYGLGMGVVTLLHILRLPTIRARVTWSAIVCVLGIIATVGGWILAPQSIKDKLIAVLPKSADAIQDKPVDLVGDGYEVKQVAKTLPDGSVVYETIRRKETWSPNALKYGLSMGIRLDTLWPNALMGLARNPLTGSGYGTLSTMDSHAFAEADSTDNNFLRTLGETGLFGFLCFYGLILFILREALRMVRQSDPLTRTLAIGVSGSIIGLLLSAVYLDVFAASKVAFTFWAITGLIMKSARLGEERRRISLQIPASIKKLSTHMYRHWGLYTALLIAFFVLHQNPYMPHTPTKDLADNILGVEQLTSARCFLQGRSFSLCRTNGLVLRSHFTPYAVLLAPFLWLLHTIGAFYYLTILLLFLTLVGAYRLVRTKASQRSWFISLLVPVAIASALRLTQSPLTNTQFLVVLIGFPLFTVLYVTLLARANGHIRTAAHSITAACIVLVFGRMVIKNDVFLRFQNIAPNVAVTALQLANGVVIPTPGRPAYLVTTLNPYFADLHGSGYYTFLPLSEAQPYRASLETVWGMPNTRSLTTMYSSLLATPTNMFVSDYGVHMNAQYALDFRRLKDQYTLHYTALGCDEKCNVYSLSAPAPLVSPNPVSPFNKKELDIKRLSRAFQFSIVHNRFDPSLMPTSGFFDSLQFARQLQPLATKPAAFLVISGDAVHKPEAIHADLFNAFPNKAPYPVLFVRGNDDISPRKYYPGVTQTFFTDTNYFILLNTEPTSRFNMEQQLQFYDALLELEKLPTVKNVFIIAHDVNWQDKSDPTNAIHVIQRRLKEFTNVHTYVFTANHDPGITTNQDWFVQTSNAQHSMTYVASLTAGNQNDAYAHVVVHEDGNIEIEKRQFTK